MSKYQWIDQPLTVDQTTKQLAHDCQIKLGLAALLRNDQIDDVNVAKQFLHPQLSQLRDPFLLHDMQKTVDRIHVAIDRQEQITIYGDYDADGITSTTIMYETLTMLGAKVNYYLPNRFIDGYGPNLDRYRDLIKAGTQLLITVDNGITGVKSIDYANRHGVDVIVTDHHERGPQLPDAYAIIYARYPGHAYPFDDFCGAGIAFKVSCALLHTVPMSLIGLAAIGTVADLVSVTDENRVIIDYGLRQIERTSRPGLKQILKNAGLNARMLNEEDIGFQIAPRFNALGRLGDAQTGIQTFLSLDDAAGIDYGNLTELQNTKRQLLVKAITKQALQQAQQKVDAGYHALVIAGTDWHEGVLGIVASQIVEQFDCPTIVMSKNSGHDFYKGSGRSVEGFNLFLALDDNRAHMVSFGGHEMACGLSVNGDELAHLQQHFEAAYQSQTHGQVLVTKLPIAFTVSAKKLTMDFYEELAQLAPFGTNNDQPHLRLQHAKINDVQQLGADQNTLKFTVVNDGQKLSAIGFKMGYLADDLQQAVDVDLAFTLGLNYWRGKVTLQLMLDDVQIKN